MTKKYEDLIHRLSSKFDKSFELTVCGIPRNTGVPPRTTTDNNLVDCMGCRDA